jgi:hypothetical protein
MSVSFRPIASNLPEANANTYFDPHDLEAGQPPVPFKRICASTQPPDYPGCTAAQVRALAASHIDGWVAVPGMGSYSVANTPIAWMCRHAHRHEAGDCKGYIQIGIASRARASTKALRPIWHLKSANGVTIGQAWRRAQLKNGWSDGVRGIWQVEWSQRAYSYEWWQLDKWDQYNSNHSGSAYYDGTDVWVAPGSHGTDPGYHDCFGDRGALIDVDVEVCSERWKTAGDGEEYVQMWDYFMASALVSGVPLSNDQDIHTNVHAGGLVTFWLGDQKQGES